MALTTPILFQQVAFDAQYDQIISFQSLGGSQVVANRLVVKDNITLATVYDQTQQSFVSRHIIPGYALENNKYYVMQVQTFDTLNNASALSNAVQFYCFTTPTITISNMPLNNVIANSSFSFDATYDQNENELLNTYIFKLYNSAQVEIANSDVKYVGSTAIPPTILSYAFAGFEDNGVYYIECVGETIHGTSVTSGKIQFTVNYIKPNIYTIVSLENNCENGNITLSSNIVLIEGSSNPSPPTYISNEEVDLSAEGSWVNWDDGFNINDDFTLKIWGRGFNDNENILSAWNKNIPQEYNQITLTYIYDTVLAKNYVELKCMHDGFDPYCVYSNYINAPLSTEQVFIWIRRVGNLFDLIIENKGVV